MVESAMMTGSSIGSLGAALGCLLLLIASQVQPNVAAATDDKTLIDEKTNFEAAFQGRCGHGSPCEQLCYELHDGMYECDCRDGYILHKNGYSCAELNATSATTSEGSAMGQISNSIENTPLDTDLSSDEEDTADDVLYMRGASFTIHLDSSRSNYSSNESRSGRSDDITNEIPEDQRRPRPNQSSRLPLQPTTTTTTTTSTTTSTISSTTTTSCSLDCGPGGSCYLELESRLDEIDSDEDDSDDDEDDEDEDEDGTNGEIEERRYQKSAANAVQRCQCPLGRGGDRCQQDAEVRSPRFTGLSWLSFPALHAAYKHVQFELEFRPEAWDGVLMLAGERDDLQGDFMALVLYHGYVEFRFDCGSGVGIVRSTEAVKLNEWNVVKLYRHRWDAWLQLNQEKRVQGRSKGLFSRITFREPLFIGGPGNTSGLERLPVRSGFRGCVRNLEVNEHRYHFPLAPQGDAVNGFDVEKCTADRCSKVPCSHGGKCLTTAGDTAICLCPLGYTGDLCETRVDLQVPSFNGSSYLKYAGLAETSLSWLELAVTLQPSSPDGVILYNGHHSDATGDFIALYLTQGHVQFTFDLGTGCATLRSEKPLVMGEWVEIRVSRTGRLASLEVENEPSQEIMAPGAFTQLSLPLNLFLGGAPSLEMYSPKLKTTSSFVGCIQTVVLNGREMSILEEALGGVNIGSCRHACESRPCGDAECRPVRERFTCRCLPNLPHPCPALEPPQHMLLASSSPSSSSSSSTSSSSSGFVTLSVTSSEGGSIFGAADRVRSTSQMPESSVPSFTGWESYLHYVDAETMKRIISYKVDINMRFRASSNSGLLLWSGRRSSQEEQRDSNEDFLALGLDRGYLTLSYNLGSGEATIRYNITRLDDDLWHRIRAVRDEQQASLIVDNGNAVSVESPGQLRQLNTDSGLYVGGAPSIERTTGGRYTRGIVGCISDLVLDSDFSVALSSPAQATNTHTCIP